MKPIIFLIIGLIIGAALFYKADIVGETLKPEQVNDFIKDNPEINTLEQVAQLNSNNDETDDITIDEYSIIKCKEKLAPYYTQGEQDYASYFCMCLSYSSSAIVDNYYDCGIASKGFASYEYFTGINACCMKDWRSS